MSTYSKILYLVQARYPIISIVSHEEFRIVKMLREIGKEKARPVHEWSCTRGLISPGGKVNKKMTNPDEILDYVSEFNGNGIFILKDFHPYIAGDPSIRRGLRDLATELPRLKNQRKHIIMLGPVSIVPVELEKDISVVDWELAGHDEFNGVLDRLKSAREKKYPGQTMKFFDSTEARALICDAGLGLTETEFENVVSMSVAISDEVEIEAILREKRNIVRRSGVLEFFEAKDGINDVGGASALKAWLTKRSSAFGPTAKKYGLPAPKGMLLLGPPGTGKSLIAKAVGDLWKRPTLRLDMGKVYGSLVGQSEENMRSVIKTAEAVAPCVLWVN